MKLLSAIVPCYNEEENVPFFYEEFTKNEAFFKEKEIEWGRWLEGWDGSGSKKAS